MKSLFPEEMMNMSSLSLESVASKLTHFHEQLHLLHWQTMSYAEHMALGSLYDYVHDVKDEIIEKMMGYMNRRVKGFKIDPISESALPSTVVSNLILFAKELEEYAEMNGMCDIENISQSLSGEAAKTKYLLTLS